MKIFVILSIILLSLIARPTHAQVSGNFTSLQVGPQILYGQEFALDFCHAAVDSSIQCLSNVVFGRPKECTDSRFDSHTCDSGRLVDCQNAHYLRGWIPNAWWFLP